MVFCRRYGLTGPAMRVGIALFLGLAAAAAQAEMWKCVDAEGNIRYTNVRGETRGCKPLNLDPPNTVPAPRAASPVQPKPANFPSVDGETQKQRDAGRRRILEQELALEQQQLEAARKQLAEQQDIRLGNERNYARVEERLKPYENRVRLHESNIESLRRELASVK